MTPSHQRKKNRRALSYKKQTISKKQTRTRIRESDLAQKARREQKVADGRDKLSGREKEEDGEQVRGQEENQH